MNTALLVNAREAAQRLGISDRKCRALIYAGDIESVQIGTRRLIPADALTAYVAALRADQT